MNEFSASIFKLGINPVVDPPDKVLREIFAQAGRSKGPMPVRGLIRDVEFIQTLVKFQGAWRLYINGKTLKASGLSLGDTANFQIEYDPLPREVPIPEEFRTALANDVAATKAYEQLTPSRRKEILRYLGSLKTAGSMERNIEKVIRQLAGKPVDKPHIAMRSRKRR